MDEGSSNSALVCLLFLYPTEKSLKKGWGRSWAFVNDLGIDKNIPMNT